MNNTNTIAAPDPVPQVPQFPMFFPPFFISSTLFYGKYIKVWMILSLIIFELKVLSFLYFFVIILIVFRKENKDEKR